MKSMFARLALFLFVGLSMLVHVIGSRLRRAPPPDSGPFRVFVIGAFDSAGWLEAHAGPLVKCRRVDEVHVICDEPVPVSLPGVFFHCTGAGTRRVFGRGISRVLMLLRYGLELRPAIFMGYHIMPNAPLALLAAGICGGRAIYQMTGGPIQVIGGGYQSENPLLRATGSSSRTQERLLLWMLGCFDLIVVRGSTSVEFLRRYGLDKKSLIITGAIDIEKFRPCQGERDGSLVSVVRLVKNKGVEPYLMTIKKLSEKDQTITNRLVGDGPARSEFEHLTRELGIEGNVEFCGRLTDVTPALGRSRIFVLLSPSEGMSIAMLEAMACGLPPVVLDVGDLGDAVSDGYNGLVFKNFDSERISSRIFELLGDQVKLKILSDNARQVIVDRFSVASIASRWDESIHILMQ